LAQFSNVQQSPWNGGTLHYYGNTEVTSSGTLNNSGSLTYNTSTLPGTTGPLVGSNGGQSGDYYVGVGVLVDGADGATVNNNSGGTMQSIVTGYGEAYAAGIWSIQNATVNNSGVCNGQVLNNDGAAYGVYVSGAGATINNNAGGTMSATAQWYANGVWAGQTASVVNNGTITAVATGGRQGVEANQTISQGVNLFSYSGNGGSPLYVENHGTITASAPGGNCTNNMNGVDEWAEGSAATLINSGTICVTNLSSEGDLNTIYFGADNGDCTLYNSGTITKTGPGTWGIEIENDSAVGTIRFANSGTIVANPGYAVGINNYSYGPGQCGNCYFTNTGTITGNPAAIGLGWGGNTTVVDSGDVHGWFYLGGGVNTVYINGLPTIDNTIDGGGSGQNTLVFTLTGTLQQINGNTASGNSFSGLGSSGSIVVSGKTYSWNNFANVSGTVSTTPTPPATTNGWYCIKNRTSGLVIDDSGGSTSAGTTMGQWAKVTSANLNWQLVSSDSGYYYIQNQTSGLYLDGFGYTTNGSVVKQWGLSGSYNQQWQPVASDSGYYYFKNRATSLYLDGGGATANGAAMKQWGYANSANLQWSLQPVDGTYKLISQNSGLSLETPGQHDANGQQINQWSYYGGGNQQWKLTDTGNGIYKIIGVESGRSLDINGGSSTNGTVVQIYDYASNKSNQQFKLTSSEVGQFRIAPNYTTSSCLDVFGASTANGALVYLWQTNGGGNQKWSFQKP
jgi:hypothetical protein